LPITTSFKDLLLRNAFLPIEVTLLSKKSVGKNAFGKINNRASYLIPSEKLKKYKRWLTSIVTVLGMITFFFVLSLLPVYLIVGVFFEADVTIYLFPFFFNFDPFGSLFWLSLACGCFIETKAFYGCKNLRKVTFQTTTLSKKSVGKNAYFFQGFIVTECLLANRSNLILHSIDCNRLGNDYLLKEVVIGKNITKIETKAFYGCKNLRKVTFQTTTLSNKDGIIKYLCGFCKPVS